MIQAIDVHKYYRLGDQQVYALRGATCQIELGQFVFILGPSGSGKSTFLYLLGALDQPSSGRIEVQGRDLAGLSETETIAYRRQNVGFVFQSFNLISNLTALENALVPFLPVGISSQRHAEAVELLTQMGLGDRLKHRPSQLSGGEQQRVAIARALLKNPLLLLADEPTGELDSQAGADIFRLLRALCDQRKTTVIVVSHDRRFIQPSDRILEIRDGRFADDPSRAPDATD